MTTGCSSQWQPLVDAAAGSLVIVSVAAAMALVVYAIENWG